VPPAAAGEEKEKEARTPRAPAGGLRPPAPPAEELWLLFGFGSGWGGYYFALLETVHYSDTLE